jgi:ribose 5-phosphate isomerase B
LQGYFFGDFITDRIRSVQEDIFYLYFFKTHTMSPFNLSLPVAIGCDHAGFEYKEAIMSFLDGKNVTCKDFGTYSSDSVDYPDFAHPVANEVESNKAAFGILICGSGNGVGITANKHQQIRAAVCWEEELAELARKHNNANIICIPARFIPEEVVEKMIDIFMHTDFEGGRHENRVKKISCT